jgi:predicted amidophosphoribosyltransferase
MYCKYCGQKIDDDSTYCSGCGAKLNIAIAKPSEPKKVDETDYEDEYEYEYDMVHTCGSCDYWHIFYLKQ